MNWKQKKRQIKYWWQFFPITLNGILLAIAAFWCYRQLGITHVKAEAALTSSSFAPFLILMGKTALFLLLALMAFCLLTVSITYAAFWWKNKKKGLTLNLDFKPLSRSKTESGFKALLNKIRRPWLGNVRIRLLYDDGQLTEKLSLLGNLREKGKWQRQGISGHQDLQLPDIKEYDLKGSFLFFEDLFHLFSLPVFLSQKGHFFQAPKTQHSSVRKARPERVERETVRIDETRPIPGDYLNYKDFEGGDDIRRIVWQVYAKSKDLVVRIPEKKDFYASHLSIYASFFSDLNQLQRQNAFSAEMLNYYKNCIWTAIHAFLQKNTPLKFISEQPYNTEDADSQANQIQKLISNAQWQTDKTLGDYLPKRGVGILFISSFTDLKGLQEMLETTGKTTLIYFVPLSFAFKHFAAWSWLKRIFLKNPKDRLQNIRSRWPFTSFRQRIKKREAGIVELLDNHDVRWGKLK